MKYDFTRCNNLQFKAKDDGGKVREGFLKVSSGGTVYVYYSNENKIFDHFLQIEFDGYHGIFTDATKFGEWAEDHGLEIVPRDPDTYKDWKVGDHVIHNEMRRITYIAAKLGDIVFLLNNDDYTVSSPCTTVQLTKYFTLVLTDYEKELIHAQELEEKKKECPFKEGDRVLVRDLDDERWRVRIFDRYHEDSTYKYECKDDDDMYKQCIPYNEKTWMLFMTTDEYKEEE